jgi:hypothetical protein
VVLAYVSLDISQSPEALSDEFLFLSGILGLLRELVLKEQLDVLLDGCDTGPGYLFLDLVIELLTDLDILISTLLLIFYT